MSWSESEDVMEAIGSSTLDEAPAEAAADAAAADPGIGFTLWVEGLVAAAAWLLAAGVTAAWPDRMDWPRTEELAGLMVLLAAVLAGIVVAERKLGPIAARIRPAGRWLAALALLVTLWEIVTAKLALLPMPFFPPPQAFLDVYIEDWPRLLQCVLHSLELLGTGYILGAAVGFLTGLGLGWSRTVGYWVHPVLRLIGPLPATAWLPLAFFIFPSGWSASVFLIGLATWFPVTILTWSGVAGVRGAYYDVARTLGADERFLVLKVAIPAAMPHLFVGLFMGLGASFAVLVVAEMMGVRAGLGWYLQWAQGWAAYANMYAALLVMALVCSGLITLVFKLRDRLLAWQKGLVRW